MRNTGNRGSGIGDRASEERIVRTGTPGVANLRLRPAASSLQPPASRSAFTLTELLVVITIIAVLAALTTAGVMRAMGTARQTKIKTELDQLDSALRAYKEKYGSYPPSDLSNLSINPALKAHVARAFPRYDLSQLGPDLLAAGLDPNVSRPDHALVFWLRGFGPDVTHPFVNISNEQIVNGAVPNPGVKVTTNSFFLFDQGRLMPLNFSSTVTYPSYIPAGIKTKAPYIYFDPVIVANPSLVKNFDTGNIWDPEKSSKLRPTVGLVRPSWIDTNGDGVINSAGNGDEYANSESFQIIAAGMDGKFSSLDPNGPSGMDDYQPFYPNGTFFNNNMPLSVIDTAYDDNISNFCDRARMGDARP
jgi:prepilin-type N-terminal cleavage/methylation domain-containing protein